MTEEAVARAMILDEDYVELLPTELLVPHYLIHCHLYYNAFRPLIPDHVFDELAQRLKAEWKEVKHFHKKLIDYKALSSGGSYIDIPLRVKVAAETLMI